MPTNNIIDIKRVESSPAEPITLQQAKNHCIITSSDDDSFITLLITKARKSVENYCHISIVAKTITLTADLYKEWELPYGPVTWITSVTTRSTNEGSGAPTYETLESGWSQEGEEFKTFIPTGTDFRFNPNQPFRGYFQWGPEASPSSMVPGNRYKIVYTAGYTTVPDDLVHAILMQIAWFYEHRGEESGFDFCESAKIYAEPFVRKLWF